MIDVLAEFFQTWLALGFDTERWLVKVLTITDRVAIRLCFRHRSGGRGRTCRGCTVAVPHLVKRLVMIDVLAEFFQAWLALGFDTERRLVKVLTITD